VSQTGQCLPVRAFLIQPVGPTIRSRRNALPRRLLNPFTGLKRRLW
jgi:hypothetical protein